MSAGTSALSVIAPAGIGEITEGTDLGALVAEVCTNGGLLDGGLLDGDIVTVTSKVVSKAEGRRVVGDRSESLAAETERIVARRGPTHIVRTRLGLTMAAAGIDNSNVTAGEHLLLPVDPDLSARRIRESVLARTGRNVGVVITDTAGRAWRNGQTDLAIGAAGLVVLEEFAGQVDSYGNPLAVTAPAVADEVASAAELACGKLGGRPVAVVRGRADLVLPPADHGTGATVLNRADGEDLFGLGAREAVLAALVERDRIAFGTPSGPADLRIALSELDPASTVVDADPSLVWQPSRADLTAASVVVRALAHAHGWTAGTGATVGNVKFSPIVP